METLTLFCLSHSIAFSLSSSVFGGLYWLNGNSGSFRGTLLFGYAGSGEEEKCAWFVRGPGRKLGTAGNPNRGAAIIEARERDNMLLMTSECEKEQNYRQFTKSQLWFQTLFDTRNCAASREYSNSTGTDGTPGFTDHWFSQWKWRPKRVWATEDGFLIPNGKSLSA